MRGGGRRRHDARDPVAGRIERRVLGRHHAVRKRQRSLDSIRRAASRSRPSTCAIIRTSTSTRPRDLPDNIEPTKIKRSAFIAAASGYYLAHRCRTGAAALLRLSYANAHARLAEDGRARGAMASDPLRIRDAANIVAQGVLREQRRLRSLERLPARRCGSAHDADDRPRRRPGGHRPGRSCPRSCRGRMSMQLAWRLLA